MEFLKFIAIVAVGFVLSYCLISVVVSLVASLDDENKKEFKMEQPRCGGKGFDLIGYECKQQVMFILGIIAATICIGVFIFIKYNFTLPINPHSTSMVLDDESGHQSYMVMLTSTPP